MTTDPALAAMTTDPALYETLETRVSRIIGDRVVRSRTLSGGMMGEVVRMTFERGHSLVVKSSGDDMDLRIEATMLQHLRDAGVVPVPTVHHAEADLLVMDDMPGEHLLTAAEPHLGTLLAALHDVTSDAHGFGGPTLNGRVVLESPWSPSWIDFFARHRLRFSFDLADTHRPLPPELRYDVYAVLDHIHELLREPDRPSLLHGDLWSANVLSSGDRVTAFLDPSTCYGDPEFELAYVAAWRSFGDGFWRAYTAHRQVDDEFYWLRSHVYALYPLLMHVYYFGDRFLPQLGETLATIRSRM